MLLKRIAPICILLLTLIMTAQTRPDQMDRGEEWLAWSSGERATFVKGFMAGYRGGSHKACDIAQDLFGKPGKMSHLGDAEHPGEMPSARCLARIQDFSKGKYTQDSGLDVSAYTDVITDFYKKHAEYLSIPYVELMTSLSDGNCNSEDDLYKMASKGQLRPLR